MMLCCCIFYYKQKRNNESSTPAEALPTEIWPGHLEALRGPRSPRPPGLGLGAFGGLRGFRGSGFGSAFDGDGIFIYISLYIYDIYININIKSNIYI